MTFKFPSTSLNDTTMPPLFGTRTVPKPVIKTKEEFGKCISSSRKGNVEDFNNLVLSAESIPPELSSDALRLFTSFLQEPRYTTFPKDVCFKLGAGSIIGLMKLTAQATLKNNVKQSYIDYLYNNWFKSLDYTRRIISAIRRSGKMELIITHFSATIALLDTVTGGHFVDVNIFDNVSAQMLSSYVWFYFPDGSDDDARPYTDKFVINLICTFIRKSRSNSCLDSLLNTIEESREESYRTHAIRRKILRMMRHYISLPSTNGNKLMLIATNADLISSILNHKEHPMGRAMLRKDVLYVLLEGVDQCKAFDITRPGTVLEKPEKMFQAAMVILDGINQCLTEKPDLIPKALRHGLVDIMIAFGRRYDFSIPDSQKDVLVTTLLSLISSTLRLLDDARVVLMLAEGLGKDPQISRHMQTEGQVHEHWKFMHDFVLNRTIIIRMHSIPEKIAHCDTCLTRSRKVAMKRCGNCLCAIYCSRQCQIKAWKELDHRRICGKGGATKQIPVRKFNPRTEMIKSAALADIIPDFNPRRLEGYTFRPQESLCYIDMQGTDPGKWSRSMCTSETFMDMDGIRDRPKLKSTVNRAFTCIKEEFRGEGTLCAVRTRKGRELPLISLFAFPINITNSLKIPLPVLPTGSKAKVEPLPDLVGIIKENLRPDTESLSLNNIDEAASNIFLDKSSLGRSARMYWQVWNRTRTFHV